jgi:hypothetical protein
MNMAVFALFSDTNHEPEYLTLKEAMEGGLFTVANGVSGR